MLAAAGASAAALFSALTVTGGTVAVLPDRFGLLGFAQRDATLWRIGGCALPVSGTAMVARG